MHQIKRKTLLGTIVLTSAVTMILELVGSRLLAPYVGTSIYAWTSLIGVILASISLGYWLGGKLADKKPKPEMLGLLLFIGGLCILGIYYLHNLVGITSALLGLRFGSFFMAAILFAPASIALSMVNPFIIKFLLQDLDSSGRTVGNAYAFSNAGAILGTFMGGYVLIATVGSSRILLILFAIVILLSAINTPRTSRRLSAERLMLAAISLVPVTFIQTGVILPSNFRLLADIDTTYGKNWVFEYTNSQGNLVRALSNTQSSTQAGMFPNDPTKLVFDYLKLFDAAFLVKSEISNALAIGGSAYIYPRHFLAESPTGKIDVVEIDPGITKIAEEYFALKPQTGLNIIHEDGRIFLNDNQTKYDAIFLDAFSSADNIPFQLTTTETMKKIAAALKPGGVLVTNVISAVSGDQNGFYEAEYWTQKEAFPYVYAFKVLPSYSDDKPQNLILVSSSLPIEEWKSDSRFDWILSNRIETPPTKNMILTDDFAPVESFSNKMNLEN